MLTHQQSVIKLAKLAYNKLSQLVFPHLYENIKMACKCNAAALLKQAIWAIFLLECTVWRNEILPESSPIKLSSNHVLLNDEKAIITLFNS